MIDGSLSTSRKYSVATFRTAGIASAPHTLFSLANPSTSEVWARVTCLTHRPSNDANVNPAVVAVYRAFVAPSAGTTLTAAKALSDVIAPTAVALGATASDLGTATAITATSTGGAVTRKTSGSVASSAGLIDDHHQDDLLTEMGELWLNPGESLVVQVEIASGSSVRHIIICGWEEHTVAPKVA